ncbi:MAG TPA: 3-oxoacyl-[acyl-carrier-protein] synthase III C-terminal domain-containing protein [Candidatus Dormibacteraeota bacterium]|nr:3-oxoacyl-[acyl-carrier-protein] synthase III C-terminal domain-containing protein [Candidatus Dormibacteraeota bacterium]
MKANTDTAEVTSGAPAHWMMSEVSVATGDAPPAPHSSRITGIGYQEPGATLSSAELLAGAAHHPHIDLERLTGIRSRHVVAPGEDSYSLAVGAALESLQRAGRTGSDVEMLINCSITHYRGGLVQHYEPPMSLAIKEAMGASQALSFDISNACAGMLTGVFILNDFIRRGIISCGMAVSGEYISGLARGAAAEVRTILSPQLASLTLGDAGVAVVLERAPKGAPGIDVVSFTTLAEHSRLCLAYPSNSRAGATMYTKAQTLQKMAIEDTPVLLEEVLRMSGLDLADVDYVIPHQTSSRAIRKGLKALTERLGSSPGHIVDNLADYGNTASTSHFVALHRYLQEGRFKKGDRVVLLALASGLEVGVVSFTMDDMVERYGRPD